MISEKFACASSDVSYLNLSELSLRFNTAALLNVV